MAFAAHQPTTISRPTVDPAEVDKFAAMAAEWWDPNGKFKPLHTFNPVRLAFIRERVLEHFGRDGAAQRPFEGLRVLDIGCGGGLLSEPMARLGAQVVGVDATEANVKVASVHAAEQGLEIDYRHASVELLEEADEPAFDLVLNMEVVEHVADVTSFMRACGRLVAPGGLMIVATINRTAKAFALAIVGAEYVMGWLPKGTHEFDKLVKPEEIRGPLTAEGLSVAAPLGVSYTPLLDRWSLSGDTAVNYMMVATRPA